MKQVLWSVATGHVCVIALHSEFTLFLVAELHRGLQTGINVAEVFQIATPAFWGRRCSFPFGFICGSKAERLCLKFPWFRFYFPNRLFLFQNLVQTGIRLSAQQNKMSKVSGAPDFLFLRCRNIPSKLQCSSWTIVVSITNFLNSNLTKSSYCSLVMCLLVLL